MSSYGHAYLTSYGWTGTGTGLRKGAIAKPLAIPPKKNLSGLGKDRDEAFPFWDHLFTAASKAISIKISSDDEDAGDTDGLDHTDSLRRTQTGIISNRRPISGTPAQSVSTSGSTTPTGGTLSLLATAKREAAKRGLYSRFFRGPVLGPDNDPRTSTASDVALESPSSSTPAREHGEQDKTRESEEDTVSKEEHKRLKKERKAARAVRAAKKAERALKKEMVKEKKNRADSLEGNATTLRPTRSCKQARKSSSYVSDDPGLITCTEEKLEGKLALASKGHQDISSTLVEATDF